MYLNDQNDLVDEHGAPFFDADLQRDLDEAEQALLRDEAALEATHRSELAAGY